MDFNTWKQFYQWGFCTIEQLKQAVKQGMLTPEQYKEICVEDYAPAAPVQPVQPQVEPSTPKVENKVETPGTTSDVKPVVEPKKEVESQVESTQSKVEMQNSSNASEGKSVQPEINLTQSETETTEVKPVE